MDQVLDSLGSGRVFSLFDVVFSFHQIKAPKDTDPLAAFCTPTGLNKWFVMSQGSSASPRWFKVINEVINDLKQVAAYLDDVIVFESDPVAHVQKIAPSSNAFERITSSFPRRRLDWVPQMQISWATPFPRRAYALMQKTCPH